MKKIGLIACSIVVVALLAAAVIHYTDDVKQTDISNPASIMKAPGAKAGAQQLETSHRENSKNTTSKANMLTAEGLARVLKFIAAGSSIRSTPDYRLFLDQAATDPALALSFIAAELDKTPAYDVMKRAYIFGALMEVSLAIRQQSPEKADEFLRSSRPLIDRQLAEPEFVAMPQQGYKDAELQTLLHHGPYTYKDNTLYAVTLQSKLMPVAIFREVATPYSRMALQEIANNSSMNRAIRDMAASGPKRETLQALKPQG